MTERLPSTRIAGTHKTHIPVAAAAVRGSCQAAGAAQNECTDARPRQGGAAGCGGSGKCGAADDANSRLAAPVWCCNKGPAASRRCCCGQAYMGGRGRKPSFLPCLLMSDLCCKQAKEKQSTFSSVSQPALPQTYICWPSAPTIQAQCGCNSSCLRISGRSRSAGCTTQQKVQAQCSNSSRTHDVWDDTTTGNGRLDQRVQLLVTTNGKLEMAGGDALHLEILGRVSGQLQHLLERATRVSEFRKHRQGTTRGSTNKPSPCYLNSRFTSACWGTNGCRSIIGEQTASCKASQPAAAICATLPTRSTHLGCEVLQNGGSVHSSGGTHTTVGGGTALEQTMDTTDGELQAGTR